MDKYEIRYLNVFKPVGQYRCAHDALASYTQTASVLQYIYAMKRLG